MSQSLYLIAECKKLVQKKYGQRHDSIARIVHLEPCQKFDLVAEVKSYNHKLGNIVEKDRVIIL